MGIFINHVLQMDISINNFYTCTSDGYIHKSCTSDGHFHKSCTSDGLFINHVLQMDFS